MLHQTIIGLEAKKQFEIAGDYPTSSSAAPAAAAISPAWRFPSCTG
jgi:predicted alternative tryptophan synthase beta-subunit